MRNGKLLQAIKFTNFVNHGFIIKAEDSDPQFGVWMVPSCRMTTTTPESGPCRLGKELRSPSIFDCKCAK